MSMSLLPTRSGGRGGAFPNLLDEFFDNSGLLSQPWGIMQSPFVGQGQMADVGRRGVVGGMLMDVSEYKDRFELHASIPGVKKDQVKLDVDGDLIKVSVDVAKEQEYTSPEGAEGEQPVTWHRKECFREYASRTMRMPDTADLTKVSAKFENGILNVNIPKKEEHAVAQRRVAIV